MIKIDVRSQWRYEFMNGESILSCTNVLVGTYLSVVQRDKRISNKNPPCYRSTYEIGTVPELGNKIQRGDCNKNL